jgi:hypothetical protein
MTLTGEEHGQGVATVQLRLLKQKHVRNVVLVQSCRPDSDVQPTSTTLDSAQMSPVQKLKRGDAHVIDLYE